MEHCYLLVNEIKELVERIPLGSHFLLLQQEKTFVLAQTVKNLPAMQETWEPRSPGGGSGYPLQYSCLENSIEEKLVGLQSIQSMESQRVRHS